ncbi:hypothetical protein DAPPUDRAFT_236741 [Daphnia pulex]|uniref:Uncharacterized protein n=1 Tax=Daphnia pulex TaxID=6669 RepID=E9G2Z6_DAPPU|nr:hypothetical protein DAPPUDRAFT_236741 [Daphnia pulex]|eukprot:EFX86419.1 hypothetical protein DAPPUDRAFT_236741 [Daphnia pulex]
MQIRSLADQNFETIPVDNGLDERRLRLVQGIPRRLVPPVKFRFSISNTQIKTIKDIRTPATSRTAGSLMEEEEQEEEQQHQNYRDGTFTLKSSLPNGFVSHWTPLRRDSFAL